MKWVDPGQCWGLHGHSTTHYLIMLFMFILSNTDNSYIPRSVLVALIDFSKAFNRINHSKVKVRLSDWGVPGRLLEILVSYLSGRSMILRYKGVNSLCHLMPGGSPQGTLLWVLIYLVYVSDIGMDLPEIPAVAPGTIDIPSVAYPPTTAITETEARLKFVDDLSIAECTSSNVSNQETLQKQLESINVSAKLHDMKLSLRKSKIMQFTLSKKHKLQPNITLEGANLDVVSETKLVGVTITDNCKWDTW